MLKEPGKHLLAICSILIPQNPLPEIRQKTNYMAVEKFIFPDGQPEAIVHWQIKSPNTEKSGPIMCFIKSTKCASQTNYLETWKVLEKIGSQKTCAQGSFLLFRSVEHDGCNQLKDSNRLSIVIISLVDFGHPGIPEVICSLQRLYSKKVSGSER